jgi:hypothetical protein
LRVGAEERQDIPFYRTPAYLGTADLYLISRNEAPRGKVLRMPLKKPDWKTAEVALPEGEDTVVSDFWGTPTVLPTESRLYVEYQLGGPSELAGLRSQRYAPNRPRAVAGGGGGRCGAARG